MALQSQKNRLGFSLRQFLGKASKQTRHTHNYTESAENKDSLLDDKATPNEWKNKAAYFLNTYHLSPLKENSSGQRYLENLSILHHLEYLNPQANFGRDSDESSSLSLLDVGCKNWSYVNALHAYFSPWAKNMLLDGIELDAYRKYTDGFYRKDYAQHYIKNLPTARYHVGDAMLLTTKYDIVTCLLPFVFEDPCLAWGLPLDYFNPQAFLNQLLNLLKPNGVLIIINQGKEEHEEQDKLLNNAKASYTLNIKDAGKLPETFYPYQHDRYGWVIQKKAEQ